MEVGSNVDTSVVETTPTVEAPPAVEAPVDAPSIADHAAQFDPAQKPEEQSLTSETPREPSTPAPTRETDAERQTREPKPRAAKQVASREDVPRIQELTRKLREAERERDEWKSRHVAPAQPEKAAPSAAVPPVADKEPQVEDFANDADPLRAYTKAIAQYTLRQEIQQAQEAVRTHQQAESRRAAIAESEKIRTALSEKVTSYETQHPGFLDRLEQVEDIKMPDNLGHVIATLDNPPHLMDYFATHVDDYVAAIGFAASLDLSEQSVALLRRYLNRYSRAIDAPQNGATGAPTPAPLRSLAPKPLTPVGTGPLSTGDDPTGEAGSIAEHAKHFGPKARRR